MQLNFRQAVFDSISDTDLLLALFQEATEYFALTKGEPPNVLHTRYALTNIPTNCLQAQKKSFFINSEIGSIGFLDYFENFPTSEIMYLSMFFIVENQQGKGFGRAAYKIVEEKIRAETVCKLIRLSVLDASKVGIFWEKMGFNFTGETKPYERGLVKGVLHIMEKKL